MRSFFLSCFLLTILFTRAENKLLLCTGYDTKGIPTGSYPTWEIQKAGNFMYLLYQSSIPIFDTLYINIDKTFSRKDTSYYQYDHYYLVPDSSKSWASNKYIFTKPGKYRISVFDRNSGDLLQSYFTTINYTDEEYQDPFFTDSWYYRETRIYFCDSIEAAQAKLIGKSEIFSYNPNRKKIILYIDQLNKKPLKTNYFLMRIYSKETHQLVKSSSYTLNQEWSWTFIPVYLTDKGKYTVELYSEDEIYINSADLEIK